MGKQVVSKHDARDKARGYWWPDTPEEIKAQRMARDAIVQIPLFPDLMNDLATPFGHSAARDFLHQLVYWFNPEHPKMADRWTAYITAEGWYEQRRINPKALKRARDRAIKAGVVAEKPGPHKRIHYRLNWIRLLELLVLSIPLRYRSEQDKDLPPSECESSTPLRYRRLIDTLKVLESDRHLKGIDGDRHLKGGDSTQEITQQSKSEDYESEDSLLQSGAEPAFAEPAPPEENDEPLGEEFGNLFDDVLDSYDEPDEPPDSGKRHSQNGDSRRETTAARKREKPTLSQATRNRVYGLVFGTGDVGRLADDYLDGSDGVTPEQVAHKAREIVGSDEPLEAFVKYVEGCLDQKWKDRELQGVDRELEHTAG